MCLKVATIWIGRASCSKLTDITESLRYLQYQGQYRYGSALMEGPFFGFRAQHQPNMGFYWLSYTFPFLQGYLCGVHSISSHIKQLIQRTVVGKIFHYIERSSCR